MDERRVRWLCRRGMKELDVMLERYMDVCWPQAGEVEREAFAWLLELQDPALWELLSGRGAKAPLKKDLEDVVERIRSLPDA